MLLRQLSTRSLTAIGLCTFSLVIITYSSLYVDLDTYTPRRLFTQTQSSTQWIAQQAIRPLIHDHTSVAIINTSRESHKEVHGMLLWMMSRFTGLKSRFYRFTELDTVNPDEEEAVLGFSKLLAPFWASATDHHINDFVHDLRHDDSIRYIIMTTCEWDFGILEEDFLDIWHSRPDDKKISVVCIQHWNQDPHSLMEFLDSKGRLGIAMLGDHALASYETTLQRLENTRSGRLAPVFPLDPHRLNLIDESEEDLDIHRIDSAVIQSRWWNGYRDLHKVYADLLDHMKEDAEAWGYTMVDEVYHPIANRSDRFILHLVGTDPAPHPPEFEHLVDLHVNLDNPEFFAVIAAADVLLPAFFGDVYTREKASSSIGDAADVRTPILADQEMADAYGYFCPASAIIMPDGFSEIDYVAMVRSGEMQWKSKRESRRDIGKCQDEWTAENMIVMARLMGLQVEDTR